MTAKEYCNCIDVFKQISDTYFADTIVSMLQDFATIKCKEQRELCFEAFKKSYEDNDIEEGLWNAIRTAKQPEV